MSEFDHTTAIEPLGDGAFAGAMDTGWWILRGPNGGYVAALLLRALTAAAADDGRAPRSLTVHFVAPPAEGPVRIETRVERTGRSVTSLSARMTQEGKLLALGLAAFSTPWPGHHDFDGLEPPDAGAPGEGRAPRGDGLPPVVSRWDMRGAIGSGPFVGADEAVTGGWLRLAEPRVADALVVAAMTDAWFPAVFTRLTEPAGLPTIDLTIHFRAPLPLAGAMPDDWLLAVFRSRLGRDGFVEEDGEIWSADGELLAQSRQLALMV
jgi:acyl-CoA thioesterase